MSEREPEPASSPDPTGSDDLLQILREQDTRERAFESLPDPVLVLDERGIVMDLNRAACELLGRTRDERIDLADVVVPEVEGGPTAVDGPVEVRRPDGTTATAVARTVVVPGERETLRLLVLGPPPPSSTPPQPPAEREHPAEQEGRSADAMERAERRIARLQAITEAALVHLSLDQLFAELLGRLRGLLRADSVTVLLLDHEQGVLRIRATSGLEREKEERLEVPLGVGVAGRIAGEQRALIVNDLGRVHAVSPFLGRRLRSLVGVPILQRGRVWGVLHAGSVRPRRFTQDDIDVLELVAARLAPAIENAELHEAERAARKAAEVDAARLRLLQRIAQALGPIRSVDEIGASILEHVVPILGCSNGAVGIIEPDERTVRLVASVGYEQGALADWQTFPITADLPAGASIIEGEPVLIGSAEERDRRFPALVGRPHSAASWAALPLTVGERRIGMIALGFSTPQRFTQQDRDLLSALAHECSQAMDRARLHETELRSRERVEATSRRLAALQSLTARFSSALTPAAIAEISVDEATRSLGADTGSVLLLNADGGLRLVATHGLDETTRAAWHGSPADLPTPAGDAIRTREVVVVEAPEGLSRYPSLARDAASGPIVAVPIQADDRAIGALVFSFPASVRFGDDERELLEALGRHCGQALERARLYETERRARKEAERARDRIARLQALGLALAEAGEPDDVYPVLVEHLLAASGGVAALVARATPEGGVEIATARGLPDPEAWIAPLGPSVEPTPITEALRTRLGVWLGSAAELAERFPRLAEAHGRLGFRGAHAALPVALGGQAFGVVAVQLAEDHPWSDEDRDFLRAIVHQSAQALAKAALHQTERAANRALERSEHRYRSLVQATSQIEWTVDPAGGFTEPQPSWEAYTGQSWDRHRGFGWLDAIHEDDREPLMERWLAARDAGTLYEASGRLWHAASGEYRSFVSRAAPVRDGEGRIFEWVGSVVDVHELRMAELAASEREAAARAEIEVAGDRLAFLAAASSILASSLDANTTLEHLADLAVPRLADWCTIEMVDDDGSIRLVAVAHADPAKVRLAWDLRQRYPQDPARADGVPEVIRTGRSILMPEIPTELLERAKAQTPELAELIEELHLRSVMVVPITMGDRALGAMQFVWAESELRYGPEDLALAEDLAHRAAVAIENARLFEAERGAREREARTRERLQILAEAGPAMAETLEARRILIALARTTVNGLADLAAAHVVEAGGRPVGVVRTHRDPGLDRELQRSATIGFPNAEDPNGLVARVLDGGEAVSEPRLTAATVDALSTTEDERAFVERVRPSSGIAVPLSARGTILGVLTLLRTGDAPAFDRDDLALAVELGRRAGALLDTARLYAERRSIADTLQRSLLPPDLPEIPGLQLGARYRPAAPGTTVGGDFYDVFEIDLEHWSVVIGDVVGKGTEAAAMMGLARYTLRTAALAENRPSSLLATLNDAILRQMPESMFCTAAVARVRREGRTVRATVSSGGHPLPLVLRADGRVHPAGEAGTLLGVFDDPTLTDSVVDLAPGDALVLYTDGVTDERRGDEEFGERRLHELLSSLAGRSADEIAAAVDVAVAAFRTGVPRDDVAVLVLRVAA